ncbi:MAG: GFA family protein [Cocleimonas sp.]
MSTNNDNSHSGKCLCGLVKYTIDSLEPNMGNCHCKMCRKFHGAAYATYAQAKRENFHWIDGEDLIKNYVGENGTVRKFCSECGSSLIFQDDIIDNHEMVHFAAGTLDTDIEVEPDVHIYLESKANWLKLEDSLPKFETGRSSKRIK